MNCGYFLINNDGEYLKKLDTANSKLEFTTDINEAKNYYNDPGGGQWSSDNERHFLNFHFKDDYGEKVTTLKGTYEEW